MSSTKGHWPDYHVRIPSTVTLECPECHARIECDVDLDQDSYCGVTLAVAGAEIDTWQCEECGIHGCPKCVSFPHPDDVDLILCAKCAEAASLERAR